MNGENHGFQIAQLKNGDYVFGDQKLGDAPINPTGQWDAWLPPDNIQNRDGFEPFCCVSEATLNCVKTLINQEYPNTDDSFAVRFLASISGTYAKEGNDPNTVAEALRKNGCPDETVWPFAVSDLATFYETIPDTVKTDAIAVFAEYAFGHSWLANTIPQTMMAALTYSPLAVGVYAWQQDATGLYISPPGAVPEHCVMVYGYEENVAWHIFDSYDPTHKRLAWDFTFYGAKRFTLHKQLATTPQAQSAWQRFLEIMYSLVGL